MDESLEHTLGQLFDLTRRPPSGVPDPNGGAFGRLIGGGPDGLLIDTEAQQVVDAIVANVARHALAGGPHPDVVDRWIIDACFTARDRGVHAALTGFEQHLTAPVRQWRVIAHCSDVALPEGHTTLDVAGCKILPDVPDDLALGDRANIATDELKGQVIATSVEARDQEAARAIAYDRFDSARAMLAAVTGNNIRPQPTTLIVSDEGHWWGGDRRTLLLPWPRLNPPGSERVWADGWHQLSDAITRSERSEWAERAVNACRWLYRSRQSWWASERIAMCFFALEALILPEGTSNKAQKLSARISDRWTLPGFNAETMRTWLRDLYREERTNAVHVGRDVRRDLDARRLEDLTAYLVSWGIWHLGDFHRVQGPCTTIAEVFDNTH